MLYNHSIPAFATLSSNADAFALLSSKISDFLAVRASHYHPAKTSYHIFPGVYSTELVLFSIDFPEKERYSDYRMEILIKQVQRSAYSRPGWRGRWKKRYFSRR